MTVRGISQFSGEKAGFVVIRDTELRAMRKFITYAAACILLWAGACLPVRADGRIQETQDVITIVIDPGHGGENEGTIENGFQEKSMTMVTARAMYEELSKYDNVEVYLTRTTDVDLGLDERAAFAASVDADFLFSIHYNASLSHELYGSEVWVSAFAPYNAYGYQFGMVQMETMRDMGLFLRGVKTRLGDNGDYYGIIRFAREQEIPAVIIEHCHVDEETDVPFCDSTEDLEAFGRADALSVAKYFGLKSEELGVDYSAYSAGELAAASPNQKVARTTADQTEPDICQITLKDANFNTGETTFEITAADYDSMLLYYSYSLDGGETYSPRQPWPNCDVVEGTYQDIADVTLQIPSGRQPHVVFRAYNLYDLYTESNTVDFLQTFLYAETEGDVEAAAGEAAMEKTADSEETTEPSESSLPGTSTFRPELPEEEQANPQVDFFSFLAVCLVIVVFLLALVVLSQMIADSRRKKRRRQRRRQDGETDQRHR